MTEPVYRPISCVFYDELEARATLRQPCAVHFVNEAGAPATHRGIITDLFIREKVEFLRCADGFELRLDRLTGVGDRELKNYC
ncbi:MAG: hypothetical protein H7330_03305 [Hymenobacteraceae bacterium]|nr:hypothetical protein [Hymenobacteraceae bacterium]